MLREMTIKENLNRFQFIMLIAATSMSISVFYYLPRIVQEKGGLVFLIPYLLSVVLFSIPIILLEIFQGQKIGKNVINYFASISKRFAFIGVWMLILGFIFLSSQALSLAWSLSYLYSSFGMSWLSNPGTFFVNNILQLTELPNMGSISIPALTSLIVSWILIYLLTFKGIKPLKKLSPVFVFIPLLTLIGITGRILMESTTLTSLRPYFVFDFTALMDPGTWFSAFSFSLLSFAFGLGVVMVYSSYQKKNTREETFFNTYSVVLLTVLFVLIMLFSVFTVSAFLTSQKDELQVIPSGGEVVFSLFPEAIGLLPESSFIATIFFFSFMFLILFLHSLSTPIGGRW